jgi:hypothetical protein
MHNFRPAYRLSHKVIMVRSYERFDVFTAVDICLLWVILQRCQYLDYIFMLYIVLCTPYNSRISDRKQDSE